MTATRLDLAGRAPLGHDEAMRLQAEELARTLRLLRGLSADAWRAPTDCPAWDVRAMYAHVLGACEAGASVRENLHQMRRAVGHRRRHGGPLEAALSHVQVSERDDLDPEEIVQRLADVADGTVAGRRRLPRLARRAPMRVDGPVEETWTLGYLVDTIYLRDLWMHRVDAARATGAVLELTGDHDGRIVADVAAEWARRHGRPVRLDLSGPAGGWYESTASASDGPAAEDVESVELDAVEFCRVLAGRAPGPGLLATIVPF